MRHRRRVHEREQHQDEIGNLSYPPHRAGVSYSKVHQSKNRKQKHMSTITTKDGRQIYYKDWGKVPVVKFSHGWPLNADAWDGQMLFLAQRGFRVVAHDRPGHGGSTHTSVGNAMNGYAADL